MGDFLGSLFWLIVTLGVLVTFHELGHFWMARLFKVKVLRFCVGFGTPIWSRYDRHGTEIAIAPFPLGGYVKMLDVRDCEVSPAELDQTFNHKTFTQKFLIMLAGPAFNFILAFVLYWLMFVVGKPEIHPTLGEPQKLMQEAGFQHKDQILKMGDQEIKTWSDVSLMLITAGIDRADLPVQVKTDAGTELMRQLPLSQVPDDVEEEDLIQAIGLRAYQVPVPAIMGELDAELPAAMSGLKTGDLVTKINGQDVKDWYAFAEHIGTIKAGPIELEALRGGERLTFQIPALADDPDNPERKVLGVRPQNPADSDLNYYRSLLYTLSYGPMAAIPQAGQEMMKITLKSFEMMGKLIMGKASLKNLSGPITIAQVANDSAERGFSWYLSFLALVSLSLGIINLMPIPMLDGGQMLFLIFEKIKGAPLSEQFEIKAQMVGLFLLISLMSLAFYNDILRSVS